MIVIKKNLILSKDFTTESGSVIKKPNIAYEEYGNEEGPVILLLHGGLSSPHAAGKFTDNDPLPGWWDAIIGPDKVLNTGKFRLIAPNSIGSMFGSSSPITINPDTGRHYGPDFPELTLIDMVRCHKTFLDELGINQLFMVCGVSMGALQTLQLSALYPDLMKGAVSVATAGRMTPSGMCMHHFMMNVIKMDPEFNNGKYEIGKPKLAMRVIHQINNVYYTHESIITELCFDESQTKMSRKANQYITMSLEEIIKGRDLNCYLRILNAINTYDLGRDTGNYEKGVLRIKCPVLLMNMNTDAEFPPYWAEEVADIINKKNPGQAKIKIIESKWGHIGCIKETKKIGKHIQELINIIK